MVSAVFHYLGPAFAVLLFARVDVLGVAWLRVVTAAVVFAAWRRPWGAVARLDRDGRRLLLAWGAVLAVMNACFYSAIDRLPLGTVATIEFVPVIVLAALGARTARNAGALLLAVPGVLLLTGARLDGDATGLAFAAANAALFAAYIVLADRVAKRPGGARIDGLAAAMLVAAVVVTPIGLVSAAPALTDPVALAAGAAVGLSSSVIPYVADQLALARLARATYALLVSLLPATATVIGVVVLAQVPSPREAAGIALVVAGVALHRPPRASDGQDGDVVEDGEGGRGHRGGGDGERAEDPLGARRPPRALPGRVGLDERPVEQPSGPLELEREGGEPDRDDDEGGSREDEHRHAAGQHREAEHDEGGSDDRMTVAMRRAPLLQAAHERRRLRGGLLELDHRRP